MNTTAITVVALALVACAFTRSSSAWSTHLKGWQKIFGLVAVIMTLVILINPELLALGLLGDTAFFDMMVLALSLQMHTFVVGAFRSGVTGQIKPASPGQNRSGHSICVSHRSQVESLFSNKSLRAGSGDLFEKRFSTYKNQVAGSILPIGGRIEVPADSSGITVLCRGIRWLGIPSPGLLYLLVTLTPIVTGVAWTFRQRLHRFLRAHEHSHTPTI